MLANLDELLAATEVWAQPVQECVGHSELRLQAINQQWVVDCVERVGQIETDQDGDLLVISRRVNTVNAVQLPRLVESYFTVLR